MTQINEFWNFISYQDVVLVSFGFGNTICPKSAEFKFWNFALVFSIMKDLGIRPIELTQLKVKDIDLETGIITITSAKHCVRRTLGLRAQTLVMLKAYILKRKRSEGQVVSC